VPAMRAYFVSCPITLYPATSASERLSFRQINRRTGHRVKHMLVDSVTGEAVDAANKARGYDLLYLNGHDLRKLPLFQGKAQLKKIVAETDVQFSESFEVDGTEMYQHACKTGLEGVVTKVRDSRYNSGRANNWVKKTCAQRETLAIAGYALDGKKFDDIYLGRQKGEELLYAGKVDHGFDPASAKELQARLKPLTRKTQPYTKRIAHRGIWVEPSLLAEIEYRAKSAEGKVRHPVFKGLREDL
jgi:bifunctional non-homologous end joining protein LigD